MPAIDPTVAPPGLAARASQTNRRLAALLEVSGIFLAGTLAARVVGRRIGLASFKERAAELPVGATPDYLDLALAVGGDLVLRYGVVLGLAFAVGWWHRSRPLAAYGVTGAGRPWSWHLHAGLLLWAVGGLPSRFLLFLSHHVDLGAGPRSWSFVDAPGSPEYWLFAAVSSFALVPVLEELLFRGYFQTRWAEDAGGAPAVLLTALAFTVSHTQYFLASPLALGMLGSLFYGALVGGWARLRTGTLLPLILAHALGNLPLPGPAEPLALALMAAIALAERRRLARWARAFAGDIAAVDSLPALGLAAAAILGILALVLLARPILPLVGTALLLAALVLEWRERRTGSRAAVAGQ